MMRWRELRIVPALDRSPALVRFAQTNLGRAVMVGVYGVLVLGGGGLKHLPIVLALVPPTFFPAHRRKLIALTTVVMLGVWAPAGEFLDGLAADAHLGRPVSKLLQAAAALAVLAAFAVILRVARARPRSVFWRWPVAAVFTIFLASLVAASEIRLRDGPARLLVWSVLAAFGQYLWYFCYSLKDRAQREPSAVAVEVGHYQPVWWGMPLSGTPVPKGGSFLDRIEAKTPEALATCQLKGLKLLMWSAVLFVVKHALSSLGIPTLHETISASEAPSCGSAWAVLLAHFADMLLGIAIGLHRVVATCRMFGFQALRGMYRPLEARSLADFWNRFHYYFKELMVEFFFYPTFVRYLRRRPALRLLAATFAAAGLGNFFFHFTRDLPAFASLGFVATIARWRTYALYTFLLAAGIGASQLLGRREPAKVSRAGRAATAFVVLGFYCLLSVLDDSVGRPLGACGRFFLALAGNP